MLALCRRISLAFGAMRDNMPPHPSRVKSRAYCVTSPYGAARVRWPVIKTHTKSEVRQHSVESARDGCECSRLHYSSSIVIVRDCSSPVPAIRCLLGIYFSVANAILELQPYLPYTCRILKILIAPLPWGYFFLLWHADLVVGVGATPSCSKNTSIKE